MNFTAESQRILFKLSFNYVPLWVCTHISTCMYWHTLSVVLTEVSGGAGNCGLFNLIAGRPTLGC